MNKLEFLDILHSLLEDKQINDLEDIMMEYIEHFHYKLLDGYTEEEICIKLGNPVDIAKQYEPEYTPANKSNKILSLTGLFTLDIFAVLGVITFFGWVAVLFAFTLASFLIGGSFILDISPYGLIPPTPYWCGAVLAISFISLSILSLLATYYNKLLLQQMTKSYLRFHKNVTNKANNKPMLPPLRVYPNIPRKQKRVIKNILLFSLNTFAISFVLAYVVCSITAQSFEFWHVFGWFV